MTHDYYYYYYQFWVINAQMKGSSSVSGFQRSVS